MMMKNILLTTALSGLMMSAAVAQTSTPPAQPADKPAATAPAPADKNAATPMDKSKDSAAKPMDKSKDSAAKPMDKSKDSAAKPMDKSKDSAATTGASKDSADSKPMDASKATDTAAAGGEPKFVASQGSDKWVFSKFNGTDVVGPDDKKIGDVSDILFDKDHKIMAYIVGVGGFLGIGEKNVAIEPSAFEVWRDPKSTSNDPNNIKFKVSWTKEQLEEAPSFEYYKAPATTASKKPSGTMGSAPGGGLGAKR